MSGDAVWVVQLSPSAVRAIDRLPHKIAAAVAEFITTTLPGDPYRLSKPLRFELTGWRVARRGDYRVTFRLITDGPEGTEGTEGPEGPEGPEGNVLYIGRVDHRAHAYRRP